MTDQEHRNQGLSRFLMEKILEDWNDSCDLIYLYANKTVLEFYPKFGFHAVNEYEYFKSIEYDENDNLEKLNMDIQADKHKLYDYAKNTKSFANISMRENADLVMFYCTSFLKDAVYYIKALDTIVIATFKDNKVYLWDIFSKEEPEFNKIISSLANFKVDEIVLGFTPKDSSSYLARIISGDDTLFIQNNRTKLFEENRIMFPLLSHA